MEGGKGRKVLNEIMNLKILPFFFLRESPSSEYYAVTSKRVSRGATTFYARATIGVASDRSLWSIAVFLIRGEASV